MSNDIPEISTNISGYSTNPIKMISLNNASKKQQDDIANNEMQTNLEAKSSMDCLNAMGCAKVNMDKRTLDSTEYFKENPDKVKAYVEFCDSLVGDGQSLENAIDTTDKVFIILNDKNTYKN